jgi:hypothetical protein
MAASDDFKEYLKAGKIADALTLALGEAIELEITTWVSSESATDASGSNTNASQALPGHRMRTRINIVDGDIENEVGSQFLGYGPYTDLKQFHLEQVQAGRQILQHNIATLQQLFMIMTSTLSHIPQASRRQQGENLPLPPSN